MTERLEQRAETICKIQQAFGDDAMGVTQIKECFNRFKLGQYFTLFISNVYLKYSLVYTLGLEDVKAEHDILLGRYQ
jgi:hypothetical protein